jgi:hypothetical protein
MAGTTGTLTATLISMLESPSGGAGARVEAIESADTSLAATPGFRTILALNASADVVEKAGQGQYPVALVYCDRLSNTLKEKFREFSGKAHMVVDIRYSQDHLSGIEFNLQIYVDAVCALLDDSRGDWGNGNFYSGGYEVNYDAVARGGRNFLQRARVGFDVEVSK